MTRICSVKDCGKPHDARNYCAKHYTRFMKHGDPLAKPVTSPREPRRYLESLVGKYSNECYIWPYDTPIKGYGQLWYNGRRWRSHRLAMELENGPPPSRNHYALHTPAICHNRACHNPKHLRWGTTKDNALDREIDGTNLTGAKNGNSKLTKPKVLEILADKRTYADIAADYDVHPTTIRHIHIGKTWAWVND